MSGRHPPGDPTSALGVRAVSLWLVAAIIGSVVFWLVQVAAGSGTITEFIGDQVVAAGGYPAWLRPATGWAVHVGVSLSYALLAGLVPRLTRRAELRVSLPITLLAAVVLGAVTAAVAPPAISVTIAVLGAWGWPTELYPLNTQISLPLWNHLLFFLLTSLIQMIGTRER
jgi:hypothetical protein